MRKFIIALIFLGLHCMVYADVLIDVRSKEEYDSGHIEGAFSMEYSVIQDHIEEITKNKMEKIYLYCRSGRRSGIALQALKALGYKDVINLGGLTEASQIWKKLKPAD